MDEPSTGPFEPDKYWPPGQRPSDREGIRLTCEACETRWLVHQSMQGFRIRCECSRWLDVPERRAARAVPARIAPVDPAVSSYAPEPDADLRDASVETRQRWLDRSILELGLMLFAIMAPYAVLLLAFEGQRRALFMPVTALASGLLVMLTATLAGQHTFAAIRRCAPSYFLEGPLVAGVWVLLALGWVHLTRDAAGAGDDPLLSLLAELGVGWALFVIAVCPAVFEEIAFRGLLQGRLMMLFGRTQGLLITAVVFGLAHGVTVGLPLQMFLGLYLGWLRDRSGSLLPGMLVHFLYNGALVLLASTG